MSYPQGGPQEPFNQYQPQYGAYGPPRDHPQATIILVLGILSLVVCQLIGPVAWVMGKRALAEVDRSGGAIGGRGQIQAGYICGIIASVLIALALVIVVIALVVGVAASGA